MLINIDFLLFLQYFSKYMHLPNQLSPKLSKKLNTLSTPSLKKQKLYLPSRYGLDVSKSNANMPIILNTIQANSKQLHKSPINLLIQSHSKGDSGKKKELYTSFNSKPLKKQANEMQNFKQIFLEPRQQALNQIQSTQKREKIIIAKKIFQDYQRFLHLDNDQDPNKQKLDDIQESQITKSYEECIQLLQSVPSQTKKTFKGFYDQQIKIEPPEPSNSVISLNGANKQAPSLPHLPNKNGNITELLMRLKAGMCTNDIQKQAHLAFYLGMVYEEKKAYHSASKFYKRFLGFAKVMEDKIGMSVGANRLAVALFYSKKIKKSIQFHLQQLQLANNQSLFAAYYNLGICYRFKKQYQKSQELLSNASQWAKDNNSLQSECIALGQLAMTYKAMQFYQKSLEKFEKSVDICRRLGKTNLLIENLHQMLLITSTYKSSTIEKISQIATQAYQCSKMVQQSKTQQIYACNIGIIAGSQLFQERIKNQQMPSQIEQYKLDQSEGEDEI